MQIEIPASPNEVGPAWVAAAFSARGQLDPPPISHVEVEVIGEGLGMLSQLARLHLTYGEEAEPGPPTVILKLASTSPPALDLAAANHWYEREVGFYRDLAPQGGVPAPDCYWCDFDPTSGSFTLLLEDLGPLVCEDQVTGIGPRRLDAAVECLADLHAYWWDSPALATYEWLPPSNWEPTHGVVEGYRLLWSTFLDRFGAALPDGVPRFGAAAADAMHQIIDDVAGRPVTLAHTDFRLDNLFFDGASGAGPTGSDRVVAIDWQLVCRTVGAFDVAYLLTQSTSVDLRRARQWDVLRTWYDRVRSQVATHYSYDDAVADYRRSALICLLYPVVGGGQLEPGNERGERLWTTIAQRAFSAAIDLDLQELL